MPSAVVASVPRSGSDLLPGCVVTEEVVSLGDLRGHADRQIEWRNHIILCAFFIVGVRAIGNDAAASAFGESARRN